jgi:putative transposase
MPRQPRAEIAGAIYHVFARGAARQTIFIDNRDRRRYLATLWRVIERMSWSCLGYSLLGNHMHLLIETTDANLSRGMHLLHGSYAQAFNRRHAKAGHVFGARYGAKHMANDAQLWVTVRYIDRNPVEAGLCRSPRDWPWGSHAALAQGVAPPCVDVPRLLSYFAPMGGDPLQRYLEFVAAEPQRT